MASMFWNYLPLALWVIVFSVARCSSLICLSCTGVLDNIECDYVQPCADGEVCYVDEVTSVSGLKVYNFGCRASQECTVRSNQLIGKRDQGRNIAPYNNNYNDNISSTRPKYLHSHGRRQQRATGGVHSITCSQCCSDILCNAKACGLPGFNLSNGQLCYSCSQQQTPTACDRIEQCGRDQECMLQKYIHHNREIYQTKCSERHVCERAVQALSSIFGKRQASTEVSPEEDCRMKCCNGTLCNTGSCPMFPTHSSTTETFTSPTKTSTPHTTNTTAPSATSAAATTETATEMTTTAFRTPTKHHLSTTATTTTTSSASTVSLTTSATHYRGHCSSSPCNNGQCYDGPDDYICRCFPGYQGFNCDQVVDPCDSSPCVYGKCYSHQTSFFCQCNPGYIGKHCETSTSVPEVKDFCAPSPCIHGHCYSSDVGYVCACNTGYTGLNCSTAIGLDHCSTNPCVHGVCHAIQSGYECMCTSGYTGQNCAHRADPCSTSPCVHGTCFSTQHGDAYHCACLPGYTGQTCSTRASHCSPSPCQHNGMCHEMSHSPYYACHCPPFTYGTHCQYAVGPWYSFHDHDYLYSSAKATFQGAIAACKHVGAELVTIKFQAEFHEIHSNLTHNIGGNQSAFWVYAENLSAHGQFTWILDNSPVDTFGWAHGQPNMGIRDAAVAFDKLFHWKWMVSEKNVEKGYICEKATAK